ncbi:3-methyladenine DNA glycosylase [bacterium]|nr:MAG: 3-methyladenine DNA glycosylase [bacterium]
MIILQETQWRQRERQHRERLEPFVGNHLARRSRAEKHPVHDFLFEYYSFRPSQLSKWSPGVNVELEGGFSGFKVLTATPNGHALDLEKFPRHRLSGMLEILEILENTAARASFHGCFGLHEWAMVYRAPEIRHASPLRLSDDLIAEFVESNTVVCSHYDAFRFFTPAAHHFNILSPTAEKRAEFEQPGCIHANMDLYKWAYKFYPWIGSDLIAATFAVARDARELDMRAAPYDLAAYNVVPIPIETAEGRREYAILQREVAESAAPVRARLIEAYRELAAALQ